MGPCACIGQNTKTKKKKNNVFFFLNVMYGADETALQQNYLFVSITALLGISLTLLSDEKTYLTL